MLKHKRAKFHLRPGRSTQLTDAEIEAKRNQELQASKKIQNESLSQMIEQRTWENGQLRQELTYQQKKHGASMYLLEEVRIATESLQQALANFQRMNADVEHRAVIGSTVAEAFPSDSQG